MKTKDSHTLLVFIKHYISEIRKSLQQQLELVKADVIDGIAQSLKLERDAYTLLQSEEAEISKLTKQDRCRREEEQTKFTSEMMERMHSLLISLNEARETKSSVNS